MSASLSVRGLSVRYGRHEVLGDLSLAPISPGTVTAFVGPNGAGKTTLLRAIAGLVHSRGTLRLGEIDLLKLAPRERARLASYMPQALPGGIRLGVLESLLATLRGSPFTRAGADVNAVEALEELGIGHLASRNLDELSGGQRQMVGLAQTLVRKTPLVFLDEPTSALDLHHQIGVMTAARSAARGGALVAMVLHDLSLASRWSDRIVVLDRGRVVGDGPPAEILTSELLAEIWKVEAVVKPVARETGNGNNGVRIDVFAVKPTNGARNVDPKTGHRPQ